MATSELLEETGEEDKELQSDLNCGLEDLTQQISEFEFRFMLSGPNDRDSAIVSIHPGAGGTESQDWAQMLFRMYSRWAEKKLFKINLLDYQPGDEAGIKSVTFSVEGDFAFGFLVFTGICNSPFTLYFPDPLK